VDDALRKLAATKDTRFRTELLVIALRVEADRRALPGGANTRSGERVRRMAAELDAVVPDSDDDLDHCANHRTARNELGRALGTVTADDWADAVRLWQAAERPREEAYCLLREAECHAGGKRRDRAAAAARAAREIADRIGATPLVADVDVFVARTRLSAAPVPRTPVEDRPYGLTDREHEVLALLGTGATNRQIARKLFISERTVGVHVSRVLHKLQVTNRAQAAALAVKVAR
jgi:DNA-binding CsgD family transcriptional regulator